ncbi:MAG: hypothetical protein C4547_01345 [Phycisphaerales bacterium]|nr:MAG: hypothetical protein C4547_01345 [Phycisphaerales bacterium]
MIVRMAGTLVEVSEESVVLERDGLAWEVMTPAYMVGRMAAEHGRQVVLHTFEVYEGSSQGGNLTPLLIGFPSPEDRRFFKRFIGVKGIGVRKALKALSEPPQRVAAWIREGDVKTLARLKGIGTRAAQQIVVDLKGKLKDIVAAHAGGGPAVVAEFTSAQKDALALLIEWGESRADAERYLTEAARQHADIELPDEWVRAALCIRSGLG